MNKADLITFLKSANYPTKSEAKSFVNIFCNLNRAIFMACPPLAWLSLQRNGLRLRREIHISIIRLS